MGQTLFDTRKTLLRIQRSPQQTAGYKKTKVHETAGYFDMKYNNEFTGLRIAAMN